LSGNGIHVMVEKRTELDVSAFPVLSKPWLRKEP
jgi:hypothetical protein